MMLCFLRFYKQITSLVSYCVILTYLRISDKITLDISVGQWLGLTPSQIVMDTLNLTAETVATAFKKEEQYIV